MAHVVAVVGDRPIVTRLRGLVSGLGGVELDDIDPWNDVAAALNAPVNTGQPNLSLVVMTVALETDAGVTGFAAALAASGDDYRLIDASTGGELGRVAPPAGHDEVELVLRSARVVD